MEVGATLGVVGVALAVPGVIDALIRGGAYIAGRVDSFHHIDKTLDRYRQLGVDISQGILWYRLQALQQASRNCAIPAAFQQRLESCLDHSMKSLEAANKNLGKVQVDIRTSRAKYVLWGEHQLNRKYIRFKSDLDQLDKICSQLHELQTGPAASFLRPEFLKLIHETPEHQPGDYLPLSDIWVADGNYQSSSGRVKGRFVLERKYRENDTRFLCNNLMGGTHEGILKCLGYRQPPYNESDPPHRPFFQLVLEIPAGSTSSLSYRISTEPLLLLKYRIALAQKISRAVAQVHSLGLVHKGIRPRAILLTSNTATANKPEDIYLQDWTYVRDINGATSQLGGDQSWQRAIYQHPDRQGGPGRYPDVEFEVTHDIYSLGVTLLELFLWTPFIERTDPTSIESPLRICGLFGDRAFGLGEGNGGLPERYRGESEKLTSRPVVTKNVWVAIASSDLALVDPRLSDIVVGCLEGGFRATAEITSRLDQIHL